MLKSRSFYVPRTYTLLTSDPDLGVAVYGADLKAIAFHGKAQKPDWHFSFPSNERRDERIADFIKGHRERAERKASERKAASNWQHDVRVGDIFRASWGYDQTNIDYYEVVMLKGKTHAVVRPIGTQSEDTGWMQGDCVPAPGKYLQQTYWDEDGVAHSRDEPPRTVKLQKGYQDGDVYFRVASYANAHREKPVEVAGVKVFQTSHWTAYA